MDKGDWRPLRYDEVAFIHIDGHNFPTIHIFSSYAAAAEHIGEITPEELEETGEARDLNSDLWIQINGWNDFYVIDHCEEKKS